MKCFKFEDIPHSINAQKRGIKCAALNGVRRSAVFTCGINAGKNPRKQELSENRIFTKRQAQIHIENCKDCEKNKIQVLVYKKCLLEILPVASDN